MNRGFYYTKRESSTVQSASFTPTSSLGKMLRPSCFIQRALKITSSKVFVNNWEIGATFPVVHILNE